MGVAAEQPGAEHRSHSENGSLVDGPRLTNRETLDNPLLVDTIQAGLRGHTFAVTERESRQRLRFNTAFSNTTAKDAVVVTWTKDEQSPFYCIEPWMGPPNSPEHKTGLHLVGAGQTQKFCVEVFLG